MSLHLDQLELQSLFDYKDGSLIWKCKNTKGKVAGTLRPQGYTVVEINSRPIMAHWIVWVMHNGSFDGQIDHIDGNRSNNRIENLRIVTRTQNQWNRKVSSNNKVGIKGVRLRKDSNKYEVRIAVNKRRLILGSYEDLELAELVAFMAREKYHGAYAKHG